MKKGKHVKKKSRRNKRRKLAWGKIVTPIISGIIICIIMSQTNAILREEKKLETVVVSDSESQEQSELKDKILNEETEENENLEVEAQGKETESKEFKIELAEEEDVKELIEKTIVENNLSEDNFAFFYYNVDTNKYYFFNENKYFTAASTVKVPVAMVYYDKINAGELTLEDTLVYASGCYEEGGGTTAATYKVSQRVPIGFLLEQSIVNSDNTAVNILINNLGWSEYRYDIAQYTDEDLPQEFYKENITSGAYGYDLLTHLYNNKENYSQLIEYMEKSSNGEYLKKYIQDYDVAHKYGSYNGYVHDYGIVFGKTTYLLGVYTKGVSNADELIANVGYEVNEALEAN